MYKIVLTDLSYTPVAELRNVGGVTFTRALSKLAPFKFRVRLDHYEADRLAACEGYIKVYRNGVLLFFGPIITAEEVAEREVQTIALTCADIGWMLIHRLGGKSMTGTQWTSVTDRAVIAKSLIDTTNTENETGIQTLTTPTSGEAITYKAGPYRHIMPMIQELGNALDGFDWRIVPLENWANGAVTSQKIGRFDSYEIIGTAQTNAVFEYGTGTRSNVLSYSKTRTRDTQATRVYHVSDYNALTAQNTTATTQWKLMEDAIAVDITDTAMRNGLLSEHVRVRANPRDLIRLTPHIDPGVTGRLPVPFTDYDIGDTIEARLSHNNVIRFAGALRVYGITATIEENSQFERIDLILEEES
jgi:hypothetical protein